MAIQRHTPNNYLNRDNPISNTRVIPIYPEEKSIGLLRKATPIRTKLCINLAEGNVIILISNILRLQSASNYTIIHTIDGKKYVISKTMKLIEAVLPSEQFVRCHKSHVVNIHEISSFKKGSLILSEDIEIPISRQKYQAVTGAIESICIVSTAL